MANKSSPVWDYFSLTTDPEKVRCKVGTCSAKIKVGKTKSTKGLWSHLKSSHKKEHDLAKSSQEAQKAAATSSASTSSIYVLASGQTATQPKISEFFQAADKFKSGHPKQKELTYMLAEWLADALLPFTTVDNPRFRAFMEAANGRFALRKQSYFRKVIFPDIYQRVKAAISNIISSEVAVCSCTCDLWTSSSQQAYISLTIHFISSEWERKTAVLGCKPIYASHTAENIGDSLKEILSSWGLTDKVHLFVRDSGANVIAALEGCHIPAVPCFCHTLQLVVNASLMAQRAIIDMNTRLGKFIKFFRKSSTAKQALAAAQKQLNLPKHTLVKGEPTRWSSYLNSMKRALEQKRAICMIAPDFNLGNDQKLLDNDWKLMEQVVSLLEPFAVATSFGEQEHSCISEVIPTIFKLTKQIDKLDPRGAYTMQAEIGNMLKNYFGGGYATNHTPKFYPIEEVDLFAVATILDPRFKGRAFQENNLGKAAAFRLEELVFDELKINQQGQASATVESPPAPKRSKLSGFFSDLSDELTSSATANPSFLEGSNDVALLDAAHNIVNTYLQETLIDTESDPLAYWKMKAIEMPILAKVAKRYLSPPMASVTSEREFKVASDITSHDRMKLLPENAEMLIFLKYNLRAIGYNSLRLPLPPARPAVAAEELEAILSDLSDVDDVESDSEAIEEKSDNEGAGVISSDDDEDV